jgi:hypothetical protein
MKKSVSVTLSGTVVAMMVLCSIRPALADAPAPTGDAPIRVEAPAPLSGPAVGQAIAAAAGSELGAPVAPEFVVNRDDRENATPTAWWTYAHQSPTDVINTINNNNARIVDLYVENAAVPYRFTVSYVHNTGAYAKAWWWYYDIDATALNNALSTNNARLISLKAFDVGGQTHFYAVMVSNTGADAKAWWWYYDKTAAEVGTLLGTNNARLVQLNSYEKSGQTRYAVVMISNTGADAKGWEWWLNVTPAFIGSKINSDNMRVLDLDYIPGTGNYNAILVSCANGCPLWWWYIGTTASQLVDVVAQTAGRIIDVNVYPGCGDVCYSFAMIDNANDITSRVGHILRTNGADGVKGLYLKQVNGPVLANLEDGYVFEPASSIKVALHLYTLRQAQAGLTNLNNIIPKYVPPVNSSCPGNTISGGETISTALREMMWHSDNTRTREISDTFGASNVNSMMTAVVGMSNSRINHIIGCGGPVPNALTLDDAGRLYEGVANGTLLNASYRNTFFQLMAGKSQYQSEGYDWTHLWDTDVPTIINQEAPAGMPAVLKQLFRNRMNLAYKAGGYLFCQNGGCTSVIQHTSIAGWADIPFCGAGNPSSKQYVFGIFISGATDTSYFNGKVTASDTTFNLTKAELLREQIRAGLTSCYRRAYVPRAVRSS